MLCYNKTSAVDVVLDVIKPHVAFLERSLNRSHRTSGGGLVTTVSPKPVTG